MTGEASTVAPPASAPPAPALARASRSFEVAKGLAILLVVLGHFPGWEIELLWVAVSAGLFVFAASSAYFTSVKYSRRPDWRAYWGNKLERLAPGFYACNAAILVPFLIQDHPGVRTWQTVVNLLGLNGVLNWFHLPNPSPLGAGMWFFTLLLVFYAAYPLLRRLAGRRWGAAVLLGAAFAAGIVLDRYVRMGHDLWLTALAFVYGVASHRLGLALRPAVSGALALVAVALLAAARWGLHTSSLNFPLMAAAAMLLVEFLKGVDVPRLAARLCAPFSKPLLEIYILHSYLYLDSPLPVPVNLAASLALILAAAWAVRLAVAGVRRAVAAARR